MEENKNRIDDETNTAEETLSVEEPDESEALSPSETPEKETDNKSEPDKQKKTLSRKAKHRMVSAAVICLAMAALILLNVVATALTDRFPVFTADITSNSAFNLTEDSIKLAEGLSKKVTIQFLAPKADYEAISTYCKQATSVANQLSGYSKGMLTVEFTDLVANPTLQNQFEGYTLTASDVVISCGEKFNILSKEDMFNFELYAQNYQYITSSKAEQAFDSAILKVTSDVTTKVALVTNDSGDDYSYFASLLSLNNYDILQLDIAKDEIPEETETLVLYAPTKDYSEDAINKLEAYYLNNNQYKKNIVYIATEYETDLPNIDAFLAKYGLQISDGLAFDMDTTRVYSSTNNYDFIIAALNSDLYTENLSEDAYPILASRAKGIVATNDDLAFQLLLYSSQSGICPFDADAETWNMSDAVTGNVCIMAQSIYGTTESNSNLVVCGSALMWSQTFLQSQYSNRDYLLNMMATLNNRHDPTIKVADKVLTQYDLNMSVSEKIIVGVIMFAVIPLAILGSGLIVFIIRRKK